jgi:hypothetical protein
MVRLNEKRDKKIKTLHCPLQQPQVFVPVEGMRGYLWNASLKKKSNKNYFIGLKYA